MCGIVGIIGRQPAAPLLLEALKRLEYRGYDSAGIATLVDSRIDRRRAEGKLANLEAVLGREPLAGVTGIGHTRWATHGPPTRDNAHPHEAGGVAVVHNGIIENFETLRDELTRAGHTFTTQTDTEVVPQLVSAYLAQGMSPVPAAEAALARLQGAFALVLLFAGHDDLLVCARRGSPLAIGYGDGEMYVGSDALALALLTDRIQYLEEGDWAVLTPRGATIYDSHGEEAQRPITQTAFSGAMIGKGNYRHFMHKEIHEQPAVLGDTLRAFTNPADNTIMLPKLPVDFAKIERLVMVACGTASYACMVARYWFEQLAGLPVDLDIGSEFRYRGTPLTPGSAALFVSQSGETMDTLEAMRCVKAQGLKTIALVNVPESTLAREADCHVRTLAGPEIGVASTKAFTTQLATLACLAVAAARARGRLSAEREAQLTQALDEVPARAAEVLLKDAEYEQIAHELIACPRRALSRPRHQLRDRSGGGAEAQGDQLHPRRGLCRRRAQARAHRADRRERAGDRGGAARPAVRQDREQPAGGGRARRQGDPLERPARLRAARGLRPHAGGAARRRPVRGAAALRDPDPAAGLPHRRAQGHGRRPAAQPREVGHGRVGRRRAPKRSGRAV